MCDVITTSSLFEKTCKSNYLVLAKINSQDLKEDFKKGFRDAYRKPILTRGATVQAAKESHKARKEKYTNCTPLKTNNEPD